MEMKKALHPKAEDTTSCYPREEKIQCYIKKVQQINDLTSLKALYLMLLWKCPKCP